MGGKHSSISDLPTNELLIKFVKDVKIDREDSYWDDLVAFNFNVPIDKSDSCLLKESVENLCSTLVVNNKSSGNLTTLACLGIYHVQTLLNEEDKLKDLPSVEKCENILLVIRCCVEYMSEHLTEDEIILHFNTLPSFENQPTIFEEFLFSLSEIVSFIPVNDHTYNMHLEAVTIKLSLFSNQMYHTKASQQSQIFTTVMNSKCSQHATSAVRILFHNYIKNDPPPQAPQGYIGWAASGFMSMIASPTKSKSISLDELHPLASHSLLLLLIYTFHYTKDKNVYRDAVFLCKPGKKSEALEDVEVDRSFPLNFKRLHSAISRDLHQDQTVLLLYIMLHKNPSFLNFVLHHKDLENLILPILKVLYNAEQQNAHHIYMALIVILIFTQHEEFNTAVHKIIVTDVSWYTERKLTDISLGSLLVLIILRTIQYNMAKMRDKYLHTNCLASLANMASQFKWLHSLATQRFIMLFKHLLKQYGKLSDKVKESESPQTEELADLEVMEEIIRMLLEILNACICHNIEENTNLIFQLLRYKELFQSFHTNPKFQDIVMNIDTAISHFGSHVGESADTSFSSADDVISILHEAAKTWSKTSLKVYPQLKFKYMEEEAAEEFFVPYIWSIIYKSSFLYWNKTNISLFHVTPSPS